MEGIGSGKGRTWKDRDRTMKKGRGRTGNRRTRKINETRGKRRTRKGQECHMQEHGWIRKEAKGNERQVKGCTRDMRRGVLADMDPPALRGAATSVRFGRGIKWTGRGGQDRRGRERKRKGHEKEGQGKETERTGNEKERREEK
jgi:hypothetical protein